MVSGLGLQRTGEIASISPRIWDDKELKTGGAKKLSENGVEHKKGL